MSVTEDSSSTAERIANSIAALPPLPATAQEILTCFGDEFIDADKVTAVVESDAGICAKLLGLANSAYFGLAEPITHIGEAISRVLGVDTVRSLVLAMAIQNTFSRKRCPEFDAQRFWTQSLLTADCCKKIAAVDEAASDEIRDLAYSAGLCYNLGLLALVHIDPVRTNEVLRRFREEGVGYGLAGHFGEALGTDHRIVTAELARTWGLPAPMLQAYQYRAFPKTECEHRLGLVVAAGVTAVESAETFDERQACLRPCAEALAMETEDLHRLAIVAERQKERVQSLASNMTR